MERHSLYKTVIFAEVLSSLLIYLALVSGCSSPVEESHDVFNLRIYPSNIEIEEGKQTSVYVWVDEASGLIATRFTLSFDPAIVEVTNVNTSGLDFIFTEADAEVIEIENNIDNEKGKIAVGIGAQKEGFTGAHGTGSIAEIWFKGKSAGECNLSFVNTQPEDIVTTVYSDNTENGWDELSVHTFNGIITVKEQEEKTEEEQSE